MMYYAKYGNDYPRHFFDEQSGYAKSSITEWSKLPSLQSVATRPWLARFKRLRTFVLHGRSNFRSQQDELYQRFLYRRRAGARVDQEWLKTEMFRILQDSKPPGYEKFRCSAGWLEKFLKHYEISHQMQTEKKQMANELLIPILLAFHRELCILQQTRGLNPRDPVYGRFSPLAIWNVDQ